MAGYRSRIIQCTKVSPFPFGFAKSAAGMQDSIANTQSVLKPTIVVLHGRPHLCLFTLWSDIFPDLSILVCSDHIGSPLEGAISALPQGGTHVYHASAQQLRNFLDVFTENSPPNRDKKRQIIQLRYRLHPFHLPLWIVRPPQIPVTSRFHVLRSWNEEEGLMYD